MRAFLATLALLVLLAGCGTENANDGAETDGDATVVLTEESPGTTGELPVVAPAATEPLELARTPALPEGPYYPAESQRPSDRDNDLLLLTGSPAVATGQPMLLQGQLLDVGGEPIAGAQIEIWQADDQGIYLHPDDPRAASRDIYFQSYGEASTGEAGSWTFRTIQPGRYEDRPRHIHVNVRKSGRELLTTQIFFAGDPGLATEPLVTELDQEMAAVVLSLEPGTDDADNPISVARHTLVVDLTP